MTTYQSLAEQTHTTVEQVKATGKTVVGNRHHITTDELHQIIALLNELKQKEGIRNDIK